LKCVLAEIVQIDILVVTESATNIKNGQDLTPLKEKRDKKLCELLICLDQKSQKGDEDE